MFRRIAIGVLMLGSALAVVPTSAYAQERFGDPYHDYRRDDRWERRHRDWERREFRERERERERERRAIERYRHHHGYYNRYGYWRP